MSTFGTPPTSTPQSSPAQPARMKPGHWVLLVFGVLLTMVGLTVSIMGIIAMAVNATQRDGGYLTSAPEEVQTTGYALLNPSLNVDVDELNDTSFPSAEEIASVQVSVTSSIPDQEIFVGVAPASDVTDYLQDVPHAELGNPAWKSRGFSTDAYPWSGRHEEKVATGSSVPADPTDQTFWTQSAAGPGTQEVTWDVASGEWSLVIMNADASRPVWVDVQAGVRSNLVASAIGPIGTGLLLTGLVSMAVGILLLLLGAARLGRSIAPGPASGTLRTASMFTVYPAGLIGHLDQPLSRWLWLVVWLLAIPHYIVLALLGFAVVFTTIASGVAILFTGRYPRSLFAFSVGVLRWTWRVGFYSYSALGTDRYPPFTLVSTDYPADFDVAYPERLSRGLVVVKWWLLAIPHLLIVVSSPPVVWERLG